MRDQPHSVTHIYVWWGTLCLLWTAFRMFPSGEFVSEVIVKPFLFLGSIGLFWKLGFLPSDIFSTIRSYFFLMPFWKILLLPLIGILSTFLIVYSTDLKLPQLVPLSILTLCLINFSTAIFEEIVFRGVLYPELASFKGKAFAFVMTQALFILLHLPILLTTSSGTDLLVSILFVGTLSVLYTYTFEKTGSLVSPILMHGVWNTLVHLFILSA